MKNTPLLITVGIVLLIAAGYVIYDKVLKEEQVEPWDLVSANAIVVYERESCSDCIEKLVASTLWQIAERAAFYRKPIDSLRTRINELIRKTSGALVSMHITKKDDFDFVFYFPGAPPEGMNSLQGYRHTSREFNSIRIDELKLANQLFSYAVIDEVWIGSFTPFLVEDVIRTHTTTPGRKFRQGPGTGSSFATIKDDAGNLYVQIRYLSDLISIFTVPTQSPHLPLGKRAILDIKPSKNNVVMNGFSVDTTDRAEFLLSIFHHQSPVALGLKNLISNRTIALTHYGVSDGELFTADRRLFASRKRPQIQDSLRKLSVLFPAIEHLTNHLSDEFGVCFLEASRGPGISKVLLIETNKASAWLAAFNDVSERFSSDTVFYEKYSQYEIREVPASRFPEKFLWPLVSGFSQSFYTAIGDVILISDNLEDLKAFLDDIDHEETWGRSVAQNRFLESTLLESNVSLYFNAARVWNMVLPSLQPKWQSFVRDNAGLLQAMEMSAFQFSHLNNNFYTNAIFTFRPYAADARDEMGDRIITNLTHGLQSLHAVQSHVNRSDEILMQDSLNDLSLISSEGKVLWKIPVGDKIVSDVTQIDFFNNGKLQYFFTTRDVIYIIDRLGKHVDPFPLHLPAMDIEYASTIDYDNSKKYRILLADKKGRLWMYDLTGKNLEGWTPRETGGSLAMAPRHHRIKGRDFIIAVRRDGQAFVMNRRGENLRHFPLDTESIPLGDHYVEIGKTLEESYFVLISRDGFRIKFNTEGRIQSREALLKTSIASDFSLVIEKSHKSYLVLQQDSKHFSLSDEQGKRLISNNLAGVTVSEVKYHDFGSGRIYIGIIDKTQGLSYVYDGQGNLLSTPPFQAHDLEIRPYNSRQIRVFFIHGNSLVIQPL